MVGWSALKPPHFAFRTTLAFSCRGRRPRRPLPLPSHPPDPMPHPQRPINHGLVQHIHKQCVPSNSTERRCRSRGLSPARVPQPRQKHAAPEQKHPRYDREIIRRGKPCQVRQAQPEPVCLVQPRRQGAEVPILKATHRAADLSAQTAPQTSPAPSRLARAEKADTPGRSAARRRRLGAARRTRWLPTA